jgi:glutaredoxin
MQLLRMSWIWALLLVLASAAYGSNAPAGGVLDGKTTFDAVEQPLATPLLADVLAFRAAEIERNNAPRIGHLRLFSARWCGYCRQAQAWLAAHNVPYENLDIDTREGMSEFARTGKKGGIPLLLGPDVEVRGFSASSYRAALSKPKR